MLILLVLFLMMLSGVCYVLFAPFYVEIDTTIHLYRIRLQRLIYLTLKMKNDEWIVELKIGSWIKHYQVFKNKQAIFQRFLFKKNRYTSQLSMKRFFKKLISVLKSFTVTQCQVSIDTGNMPLNGLLYPLFWLVSKYTKKQIEINFRNDTYISLQIKNNLARITWAYITT